MNPELEAWLFSDGGLHIEAVTPEADDAIFKLFEDAKFDKALGTPGGAVALQAETADLNKRAGELWRHETAPLGGRHITFELEPAVITDDDGRLAKMETGADRRKRNLSVWLAGELALGKSAGELIRHARQYDAVTANLLQEISDELELEVA
jgi:hypothetical protein